MTEPMPTWNNPSTDKWVMDSEPLSTKQLHELIVSQSMTIDRLLGEVERLKDCIGLLRNWAKAYPLDMFPEPDLKLARKLLEDGGVNYSTLNVYSMRHVINGVGKIIDEALGEVDK
jgi:predicted P-loop ATPase/GTPase